MPAGDAGRPYGTPAEENAWDVANELRAENDRLQIQLAAQQAVVDAARWIEEDGWTPVTRAALMDALMHLPAESAQAAQPEGERAG